MSQMNEYESNTKENEHNNQEGKESKKQTQETKGLIKKLWKRLNE